MKAIAAKLYNNPTACAGAVQAGNAVWAAEGHPPLAVTIVVAVIVAAANWGVVKPVKRLR